MTLHVRLGAVCGETVLFLPLFDRQSLISLLQEIQFQGCLVELTGPLPFALVQALIDQLENRLLIIDGMNIPSWDDLERAMIAFLEKIDRTFSLTWLWQYEINRSFQILYGSKDTSVALSFNDRTSLSKPPQERRRWLFQKLWRGRKGYGEKIIAELPEVTAYLQHYRQAVTVYPMYREQLLKHRAMCLSDKDRPALKGHWKDENENRAERIALQWLYLRGELTMLPSMRLVEIEGRFSFYCERCHTMIQQPEVWDCFDCGEKDIFCPICQALGPSHGCKLVIMRPKNR